jgi:hypothetical protein
MNIQDNSRNQHYTLHVGRGATEIAMASLTKGADLNIQDNLFNQTALRVA